MKGRQFHRVIDNDNFVSPIPRGNGSNEGSLFYLLHRGVPSKGAKEGGEEGESRRTMQGRLERIAEFFAQLN